jgi:hypothetical protein
MLAAQGGASAQSYSFDTNGTPIFITVAPDGSVSGNQPNSNPDRVMTMYGHMHRSGTIEGLWFQNLSNQACTTPHHGTYYWGRFVITNPEDRRVYGMYGYCDESPGHSWDMRSRY